MKTVAITVNRKFLKGSISRNLFGSFVEHMGRVVYTGIYEPTHPSADNDGFRTDVMEMIRRMGITCIRYPGGNFVSNYDWRDGIGPKSERPRRRELAWKSIETNEVGTDEFLSWVRRLPAEPVMAVNLGTRGVENALSLLEYCNLPAGTLYSDLRAQNGQMEPYGVKTWCLGNEMDGTWQIGHKSAEDYGTLAAQTAYAMKSLDDSIRLVVCGSSSTSMQTYTDWERIVLEHTCEFVDYISLHQYYGGQEAGTEEFLAQSMELENYIHTVSGICDMVCSRKRLRRKLSISIDEWGVWEMPGEEVAQTVSSRDWAIAPAFSEQIYTMQDSLLFASMMMAMIRNSDRVKMACQSLLTNVSAAIMTEPDGGCWVQPIYYPFALMAEYARGRVMEMAGEVPCYSSRRYGKIPVLDILPVCSEKEVIVFVVNRLDEKISLCLVLEGYKWRKLTEHVLMRAADLNATNQENPDCVRPERMQVDEELLSGELRQTVEPYSFNMYRISVEC